MTTTENNVAAQAGDEPMRAVVALAWKWHDEAVADGFAASEPAQELFELLGWPDRAAQVSPRATADVERDSGIGAVLAYESKGRSGVCGQTVGADGSGQFVVVFHGASDEANELARDYAKGLQKSGHRLISCILVGSEDESYSGPAITHIATTKPGV